ncbi:CopD family protein [Haloprofundus halophilus]|uniref:CopD family protein n=1 Tax=Haloprofundus halophilus TaxID=2283527 RepID=UPI000E44ADA2|nr:CopD family protein [Haloprofundus halophilus]
MAIIDTTVRVVHALFAGAWAGGTLLFVGAVLPAARNGVLDAPALRAVTKRFSYLSVAAVLLLLFTGGHLAGTLYTFERLQSTGAGHLVLSMVALWFLLAGVAHVATKRLTDALETDDPKSAVDRTWNLFVLAALLATGLLVVAGLL